MNQEFTPFVIPLDQLHNSDFWDDEEFIAECMEAEAKALDEQKHRHYLLNQSSDVSGVSEFFCVDPNLPIILERLNNIREKAMKNLNIRNDNNNSITHSANVVSSGSSERDSEKLSMAISKMAQCWFQCGLVSSKFMT